jgi:hypothetical protein
MRKIAKTLKMTFTVEMIPEHGAHVHASASTALDISLKPPGSSFAAFHRADDSRVDAPTPNAAAAWL